jgi:hypothetical protein
MNEAEFRFAVSEMRRHQKEYFKTRNKSAMQEAKIWERKIDMVLLEQATPHLF